VSVARRVDRLDKSPGNGIKNADERMKVGAYTRPLLISS